MSSQEEDREKALKAWGINQAAVIFAALLSVALPLAWGWSTMSNPGGFGWDGLAKFWILSLLGIGAVGEFIRRMSNWELGEPICTWFWQK